MSAGSTSPWSLPKGIMKPQPKDRCWYCTKPIEFVEGFGWREVGTEQGFICWHQSGGRMMDGEHEPQGGQR